MTRTYDVIVTREDDSWLADVPSVPGAHTFARTLESLDREVRDVIVLMDDLDEADAANLRLSYRYNVDDPDVTAAEQLEVQRRQLAEREAELHAETTRIVTALSSKGYSVRDIGPLVGLSPGRISQITTAAAKEAS